MVCTNCGSNRATVRLGATAAGDGRDLALCASCARRVAGARGLAPFGPSIVDTLFTQLLHPLIHEQRGRTRAADFLGEAARRHLEAAATVAAERGSEDVKPEHLLRSMAADPALADLFARQLGADPAALVAALDAEMGPGEPLPPPEAIYLAPRLKRVLQLAHDQAVGQGHGTVDPARLLLGILAEGESLAAQLLASEVDRGRPRLTPPGARLGTPAAPPAGEGPGPLGEQLGRFTRDLTALARQGKLDPVIGREEEIDRTIRILSRRTKNNPVLIGEPGVGKTAIAEGLAQRIVAGDVPDTLKDQAVLALDLAAMVAGTKHRGEFEERLKGLMDEIGRNQGAVVLFIDELHTILGAGAAEGAMDAANMLKPALARGLLRCVGATTIDEYRKHVEKDAALERRFQPVVVGEPTVEQALAILRGLRDLYEAHHAVRITDEALTAAVELSDQHVADRFLPDKAIDVLDEACAMKRLAARSQPRRIQALEHELEGARLAKEAALREEDFERAQACKAQIEAVEGLLAEAVKGWRTEAGRAEPAVGLDDVARIVSEWTGIPVTKLVAEERQRLLDMERHLHRRVIGQEAAIGAVSEAVRRARAGLKDAGRPIGSFIFLGPTGVGKTELAKALAEYLFNDQDAVLRFDMSEYQEKHTVSRLVGAPPGYVGHEEAGQLTNALRRKPYSVVLFDEIEKAHPDVFNVLLQLLDDGRLTDSKGKTVDGKNCVVILTSNVGAKHIFELEEQGRPWAEIEQAALEAMKAQFRPEFLNRLDEIVVFHPLSRPQVLEIVDLMLEGTRRKLHAQHLAVTFTEAARQAIADAGFDPTYGARPLRRAIQKAIETPLSRMLLEDGAPAGATIAIDAEAGRFTFAVAPAPERSAS